MYHTCEKLTATASSHSGKEYQTNLNQQYGNTINLIKFCNWTTVDHEKVNLHTQ